MIHRSPFTNHARRSPTKHQLPDKELERTTLKSPLCPPLLELRNRHRVDCLHQAGHEFDPLAPAQVATGTGMHVQCNFYLKDMCVILRCISNRSSIDHSASQAPRNPSLILPIRCTKYHGYHIRGLNYTRYTPTRMCWSQPSASVARHVKCPASL